MSESTLIHSAGDERVWQAAQGMRPERGMVLHETRFYRFAPSTTTYKVAPNGDGTYVYFYGTDESDQSCAVRVSGFRPYMYVSLANVPDDAAGAAVVERLVAQLQAQLLTITAYNTDSWSAERQAFCSALVGNVRQFREEGERYQSDPKSVTQVYEPTGNCMPIVDWEITTGRMIKGNGVNSGYRGMEAKRFLKLYFYSPKLVPLCRALLHGKFARRGALRQAQLLARRAKRAEEMQAGAQKKSAPMSALDRKLKAAYAEHDYRSVLLTKAYDETGDGTSSDSDDDDTPAVQGPLQARSWDSILDTVDDRLAGEFVGGGSDDEDDDEHDEEAVKMAEEDERLAPHLRALGSTLQSLRMVVEKEQAQENKAFIEALLRSALRAKASAMLAEAAPANRALECWDVCEADIDFVLRVMLDCGFAPEEFVQVDMRLELATLPNGEEAPAPIGVELMHGNKWCETRAQIELRCDYRHLARCENEALQNTAAKHLTLSLDCEMKTAPDGGFADPRTEQMIQCVFIVRDEHAVEMRRAAVLAPQGKFYFRSVSFVLGTVDCRADAREFCTGRHILSFADEATMYRAMARFIALLDPQIVTGYNSNSFDMPYMKRRAAVVGCEEEWSRAWSRSASKFKTLTIRQREFQSTAAGKVVFSDVCAEGVLFIDVLHQLRKDPMIKLRSYALNAVAHLFLNASKEDVSYALINTYNETAAGREKLRSYCEKDALLPLEIIQKRQILIALIEMARINNCPIEVIINRGQQVRCKCALYKAGAKETPQQLFYTRTQAERDAEQNDTYEGAEVVQPVPGLYENPVVTLDWNSLYPTEQVTHNFCPGTLVQPDYSLIDDPHVMRCANPAAELSMEERLRRAEAATYVVTDMLTKEPYTEGPVPRADGSPPMRYLRHPVCVGISTKVQQNYLAHRARTKKAMEAAELAGDSETQALLDQRQLAIKMLANSLYGMFGATCSFLYAPSIAAAITQRGRCSLYQMRWLAMNEFRQYGTEVIYGDTDSIFVLMRNVKTIEEAAEIGKQMAQFITAHMKATYTTDAPQYNILKLAFEKVFRRLLLLAKKRYAGLKYEYSNVTGQLTPYKNKEGFPVTSGLESKRRDVTVLVGESIEDVIALLLDFRYTSQENLARAREFVWQTMVRPLLDGSVNMFQLAITKQLRDLPDKYRERNPGRALPIHVQLAEKLIERAGGPDAANAPRSGERLSYVVVRGTGPVSQRAEDPVYALDNGVPIDAHYYLDSHVKKTLLRIFAPVCASIPSQRTLTGDKLIGRVAFGSSKTQRQRVLDDAASEFLFGHVNQYIDPVPAAQRHLTQRILPMFKESQAKKRTLVRYRASASVADAAAKRPTAAGPAVRSVGVAAARCARCKRITAGLTVGDLCPACRKVMDVGAVDRAHNSLLQMVGDIEDLRAERSELVSTCQKCMGCASAPQQITCKNAECRTFWVRKTNLGSIDELERRMQTQLRIGVEAKRYLRIRDDDNSEPVELDE